MAYNHGREERKWRIWKEAEEKVLREYGMDEDTIEQIHTDDRADFNSNRRFYRWTSNFGEYLEGMADNVQITEVKTIADLLDEINNIYDILTELPKEKRLAFFEQISKPKDLDFVKEMDGIYYVVCSHFDREQREDMITKVHRILA